jgi:hypothetical protein
MLLLGLATSSGSTHQQRGSQAGIQHACGCRYQAGSCLLVAPWRDWRQHRQLSLRTGNKGRIDVAPRGSCERWLVRWCSARRQRRTGLLAGLARDAIATGTHRDHLDSPLHSRDAGRISSAAQRTARRARAPRHPCHSQTLTGRILRVDHDLHLR